VTQLPDSVQRRFNLDTAFYAKFASADGIPVIASAKVPDEALLVTRDIIRHMLLKRPDLRANIIQRGGRVGVMAVTEMTTDIPEQRNWKKPALDDRRLTDGERARYNEPGGIGFHDRQAVLGPSRARHGRHLHDLRRGECPRVSGHSVLR
jgi:hypothetical protein